MGVWMCSISRKEEEERHKDMKMMIPLEADLEEALNSFICKIIIL